LQGFERVVAPFPGVIMTRQAEIGNMVMDGSSTTTQPLFQLAQIDTLRLFIDVPQSHATEIKEGQTVNLVVREYPGRVFTGKVARTSHALDRATRTLRTEIQIPNPKRELLRGMYAQASLNVLHDRPIYLLPASALIVNADGTQVAVVRDGRVHFQKITLDGDYGAKFAVSTGLNADDIVISTPSERLLEGMEVSAGK
jgi:RND family efflux transporter MFP subunit